MRIPLNWPNSPPVITSSAHLEHPNVFGQWGQRNGDGAYICCDLLKQPDECWIEPGYKGGYTAAYPLQTICMQLLSFFSVQKVEQEGWGYFVDMHGELVTQYLEDGFWSDGNLREACQNVQCVHEDVKVEEAFIKYPKSVIREYKNITDYSGRITPYLPKAGTWKPKGVDTIQGEVEITRLSQAAQKECGIKRFRIRHRNPRWLKAVHHIQRWDCKQCGHNKDSQTFVDDSMMKTLKELCRIADGLHNAPSNGMPSEFFSNDKGTDMI